MSIKIAAFPKCFENDIGPGRRLSVFEWIAMAEGELQIEGLELYDGFLDSLEPAYLRKVAEAVHAAGFVMPMFLCSPDFTQPDAGDRQRAVEREARMIEAARALGGHGSTCRILSGQQRPDVSRAQGVEWVVEAIQSLIPVARSAGVVLALENHYKDARWSRPEFALKRDVFLEIVGAIDEREWFGVQFDPSNALIVGEDPLVLLEAVQERVVSIHASDRYLKPGAAPLALTAPPAQGYPSSLAHGVIGQGLNDYPRIFQILAANGFHGWVSIEDGLNGMAEMQASAAYLRGLREQYFP